MAGFLDDLTVDGLIKIALLLAAIWLALEIVGWLTSTFVDSLRPIVALVVLVLALLWYYDRL